MCAAGLGQTVGIFASGSNRRLFFDGTVHWYCSGHDGFSIGLVQKIALPEPARQALLTSDGPSRAYLLIAVEVEGQKLGFENSVAKNFGGAERVLALSDTAWEWAAEKSKRTKLNCPRFKADIDGHLFTVAGICCMPPFRLFDTTFSRWLFLTRRSSVLCHRLPAANDRPTFLSFAAPARRS